MNPKDNKAQSKPQVNLQGTAKISDKEENLKVVPRGGVGLGKD
jgi:hypothetical protein